MEIKCLASSSEGNAFIIINQDTTFLLEAGLDMKTLVRKLNAEGINLSQVKAVVISHEHGDHAKAAPKLSRMMPIIGSSLTLSAIPTLEQRHPLKEWESAKVGSFSVMPFFVDHDVVGACGYIITDALNREKLLFATDTKYIKYDFSKIQFDYIMIECNHIYDLAINDPRMRRKVITHMSLDTARLSLSRLDLSKTKAIYLIHLSDHNSDEARMRNEIQAATGKPTYVCQKNGGVV
jgi:phosphoribosyl 1,2-cyclic phosphodiesterase